MVLVDAVARLLPGALGSEESPRDRELLRRARRRARVPALHAAGRVPRLAGARRAPLRRPRAGSTSGAASRAASERRVSGLVRVLGVGRDASAATRSATAVPPATADTTTSRSSASEDARRRTRRPRSPRRPTRLDAATLRAPTQAATAARPRAVRTTRRARASAAVGADAALAEPVDRLTRRPARGWRIAIDWVVTIVGAIAIVLAIKAWVVNPYRIPSSSMEPTLHCARPGDRAARRGSPTGCSRTASSTTSATRTAGDIIVFKTPPRRRGAAAAPAARSSSG